MNKINPQAQIFHPVFVCDIFYWLYNFSFLEINVIKINRIDLFPLVEMNEFPLS